MKLTYARIAAGLAIVLTLASGVAAAVRVPAASVGPRQLRRLAVTGPKLHANSVDSRVVKRGSLTAGDVAPGQGPVGPVGPVGITGPVGDPGPPTLLEIHYVSGAPVTLTPTSSGTAFGGSCSSRLFRAVGGGAQISGADSGNAFLTSSGRSFTRWTASGYNGTATDQTLTTTTICVRGTP